MATTPFTSAVVSDNWAALWSAKNSAIKEPAVYQELYKKFGGNAEFLEMMKILGRKQAVTSDDITVFEREAPERSLKVGTELATGAAGANITLNLHADNFDTNSKLALRVGDSVLIPAQYVAGSVSRSYRVSAIVGANATLVPYSGDGNTISASQITTAIPAGTWLAAAGANTHATGTDQPEGLTDDWSTLTHRTSILKTTFKIEGQLNSGSYYAPVARDMGGGNLFVSSFASMQAEFNLDSQEEYQLLLGEQNDNSSLTETTELSGTQLIRSGKGLWHWLSEEGQSFTYTGTFDYSDFYDIGKVFESQHVMANKALFPHGPELGRYLEQAGLDFIKEYSGGTDLFDKMQAKLGVAIKVVNINGIEYVLKPMKSWANPNKLGMNINDSYAYEFPTGGIVIPDEDVTIKASGDKTFNIPNVNITYVSKNGENRERVFGLKKGMAAPGMGMGNDVSTGYDTVHGYFLSTTGLIGGAFNKMIQLTKA